MNPKAPDAGDQFFWDLLASRADLVLVTGDKLLPQDLAMQERVMLLQVFALNRAGAEILLGHKSKICTGLFFKPGNFRLA